MFYGTGLLLPLGAGCNLSTDLPKAPSSSLILSKLLPFLSGQGAKMPGYFLATPTDPRVSQALYAPIPASVFLSPLSSFLSRGEQRDPEAGIKQVSSPFTTPGTITTRTTAIRTISKTPGRGNEKKKTNLEVAFGVSESSALIGAH